MTRSEFNQVFQSICKYYDKDYIKDEEMQQIYFSEMKYINNDFSKYMENIYNKFKFFPKVAELKELRFKIKEDKGDTVNINNKVCDCEYCNGSGYRDIIENRNKIPYTFAVACDCKNGDNKLYDGSKIQDKKYRTDYVVRRFSNYVRTWDKLQ